MLYTRDGRVNLVKDSQAQIIAALYVELYRVRYEDGLASDWALFRALFGGPQHYTKGAPRTGLADIEGITVYVF